MSRLVMSVIMAGCVLTISQGANAQAVFKCKAADGSVYFTDKACPSGSTGSVEQQASQAQYESRRDAADPRKQMEAQEAYDHNMAAGQVAAQKEREQRAAVAQRDAAINASIANANGQESRERMSNMAHDANFQANSSLNRGLPSSARVEMQERANYYNQQAQTDQAGLDEVAREARNQANSRVANRDRAPLAQAQLKESAGMFSEAAASGQRVTRGDLNAVDQKYDDKRRTQAIQAAAVAAQAAAQAHAEKPFEHRTISNCDGSGCYDTQGSYYSGSGGSFTGAGGKMCIRAGDTLNCH